MFCMFVTLCLFLPFYILRVSHILFLYPCLPFCSGVFRYFCTYHFVLSCLSSDPPFYFFTCFKCVVPVCRPFVFYLFTLMYLYMCCVVLTFLLVLLPFFYISTLVTFFIWFVLFTSFVHLFYFLIVYTLFLHI